MAGGVSKREQLRGERRQQILEAALAVFSDKGFNAANVSDVAARVGEFKPVDAESLVWAMMAAYDGLPAYVMLMPGLHLARISQAFIETLITGLQVKVQGNASES